MQNIESILNGVNDEIMISSDRLTQQEAVNLQDKEAWQNNDINNYQSLWRAVITQALMDAGNNFKKPEYKKIKAEATSWLSGYSEDFNQVCIMADIDPEYVKQKAKEAIKRDCKWRKETNHSSKKKLSGAEIIQFKRAENQRLHY